MCVQRSDMRLVWLKTRWLLQDHWKTLAIWGAGALLFLFAPWASAEAARLENPGNDQFYSGIGAISGWKCDVSGPLTIRFNGGQPVSLIYGSERLDTRQVCGDMNNGFAVLWNWALLGDGRHTARVYDNGNLFAQATFEVRTLGTEFLRGFEEDTGGNFAWNENTQHFEMRGMFRFEYDEDKESLEQYLEREEQYLERLEQYRVQLDRRPPAWHAPAAQLENPGDGQLYSGIGVISGWKCDVSGPLTIRFNGGQPVSLIYGSERADTEPVCGDTDNGFVALWNWALLGDGIHTARAYDNGVAFAEITFQVGTAGGEWWSGTRCHPANPQTCWVETLISTLPIPSSPSSKIGYDGGFWSDRPSGAGLWNTYFKWNASTQHFEVVARRQYQPFSPPEPPESWRWQERSFADRPDDLTGPQIHIYYAEPSDARGRYDRIGYISAAVQDAQRWLAARTDQGRAFRIDTYQGRPDVTTLPLDVTTAEMQAANLPETVFDTPILPGGVSLYNLERRDPNKLHFVFIAAPPALDEDSWRSICGVASPRTGVAVMFSGRPFLPQHGNSFCGSQTEIFLHEVFHLLGAVHPDAPHADGTSHVAYIPFEIDEGSFDEDGNRLGRADSLPKRRDLMQPGAGRESELDIGSDDYYFHPEKTPVWPPPHYDTVDSPFFTDGPWTDVTRTVSAHLQPSSRASLSPMGAVRDLPLPHELEAVEESWCPGPWLGTTIPPFRP